MGMGKEIELIPVIPLSQVGDSPERFFHPVIKLHLSCFVFEIILQYTGKFPVIRSVFFVP